MPGEKTGQLEPKPEILEESSAHSTIESEHHRSDHPPPLNRSSNTRHFSQQFTGSFSQQFAAARSTSSRTLLGAKEALTGVTQASLIRQQKKLDALLEEFRQYR